MSHFIILKTQLEPTTSDYEAGQARERFRVVQPLAYSIADLALATSISRSALYEAISSRRLPAKKCGNRTVVTHAAAVDWLERLPDAAADCRHQSSDGAQEGRANDARNREW